MPGGLTVSGEVSAWRFDYLALRRGVCLKV